MLYKNTHGKKSVEELNDILRNHFGATAGENISLEARLTATVTERDEKQVSTTAFSVTAYKPLTSTLYLIGSALRAAGVPMMRQR